MLARLCLLGLLAAVLCERTLDELIIDAVTDVSGVDFIQDNDTLLVELDIILTAADWQRRKHPDRSGYAAIKTGLWPHGVVPYEPLPTNVFNAEERAKIEAAFSEYHRLTCIRFRQARPDEKEKIYFYSGNGCSSAVGVAGYRQPVSLAPGCRHHGVIVHELGHAVGLNHEQSRPDRDNYVTIVEDNIDEDMLYNFKKYNRDYIDSRSLPYDYLSIMHYGKTAFAINRATPSIRTHDPNYQGRIGQRKGLSFDDVQVLNLMYNCAGHCTKTCQKGAFLGKDCECYCKQPRTGQNGKPLAICGTENKGGSEGGNECVNTKARCDEYASTGTCEIDPKYMKKYCPKACGFCGGSGGTGGTGGTGGGGAGASDCVNLKVRCDEYAREGTCTTDRNYMMRFCKKACSFCGNPSSGGGAGASDCVDEKAECQKYADWGTCKSDPAYMMRHCKKICNFCGAASSIAAAPGCVDLKPSCKIWARSNGCERDPQYMKTNCRESCNLCSRKASSDDNKAICVDVSSRCENFVKYGGCEKNPHWMHQFCRKSCSMCRGAYRTGKCRDAHSHCQPWVDRGMCDDLKTYMKFNCAKSCGLCK